MADGITVTELSWIEGTTQPGVSRALARLDREVGTPLLHRSGRILRMTHAGAAFKHHVDAMLHQLDDGLAAVHQLVDPETGTVTLAFHSSLGTWLVPELVSSFRAKHPEVRILLRPQVEEVATTVGARSDIDLELSTVRPVPGSARWARLVEEPLFLAVPAGHHLIDRDQPLDLVDAADESFVLFRSGSALRDRVDALATRAGFTPHMAFECEDLATARAFVAAGLGVSLLPSLLAPGTNAASQVYYLPLTDRLAVREIGLVWSDEHQMLPAARLFHQHVLERTA